jgi:hypothetical protein
MKRMIRGMAAALCITAALLPVSAAAQTSDKWQFGAAIYGWFPSIDGSTTFPQSTAGSDISIDASTILRALEFVFMGSLEARKGQWGAFTDILYLDLGDNRSETRELSIGGNPLPVGASASVNYDLKGLVWTLAGSYRVVADPAATLDVFAGARLADVEQKLDWAVSGNIGTIPLPGRTGNLTVSKKNWDGIVGVKGRLAFGPDRRWFVPYYVDVGAGDSDLTLQAMTGIGYAFQWGDVLAAYRYLDYEMKAGRPISELNLSGPALAIVLHW